LAPEPFTPDAAAQKKLFSRYGISFTDLVKRASRGGAQLRVGDYWTGAPQLKGKLLHYRPQAAWFHGKMAYGQFRKHTEGALPATIEWEFQTGLIGTSRIFVTPNPSPANAAFSLAALTHWYKPPCGRTQPPLIAIRGLLLTPRAALHFPHLV
jgi:double-stranded uracil-DNA glycosylase